MCIKTSIVYNRYVLSDLHLIISPRRNDKRRLGLLFHGTYIMYCCSNALGANVGHILRVAVTGAALAESAGQHDVGAGVVDGDVHRDRQPPPAAARRLPDGRGRAQDVPGRVRPARAGRLGADPVDQ